MLPGLLVCGTRRWDGSGGDGCVACEVAEVVGCLLGVP